MKIKRLSNDELNRLDVFSWPIWSCEVSKFPWKYDQRESCLILEGDIIITTEKQSLHIKENDFVIFPKGLSCHWNVRKSVKKHYIFE